MPSRPSTDPSLLTNSLRSPTLPVVSLEFILLPAPMLADDDTLPMSFSKVPVTPRYIRTASSNTGTIRTRSVMDAELTFPGALVRR